MRRDTRPRDKDASGFDATAHLVENPHLTSTLNRHQVPITLLMIALLGAVFLKGFSEAIGVAVALVATYLGLNVVVVAVGLWQVATQPHVVADWTQALTTEHGNPFMMIAIALVVFPELVCRC